MVYYCKKVPKKWERDFRIGQRANAGKILRSMIKKRLDYLQKTVSRSMDVNDSASEDWEESKQHGRENIYHLREYLNHRKWTVRGNTDVKGTACEGTEGNEVHVTENWKKGNPCYIMTET